MDRRYVRLDPKKVYYLYLKKGWNLRTLITQAGLLATMEGNQQSLTEVPRLTKELEDEQISEEDRLQRLRRFTLCAKQSMSQVAEPKKSEDFSERTVKKAVNGQPIFVRTALAFAKFLGADDLISILHPDYLDQLALPSEWPSPLDFFTYVGEWEAVEPVGSAQLAPNGLAYDNWKLRHRQIPNRLAHGKCYSLNKLSNKQRTALRAYLTRHCEVCDRVGTHPNIVRNRDAIPWEHGRLWWIIDEWVEGSRLDRLIGDLHLEPSAIPDLMRQIAVGLLALHNQGIIRRALAPNHVWVCRSDRTAVLSDLELAKLLEGAPTVAPTSGWRDDNYQAIEVADNTPLTPRADIYSWGRIAVEALCGFLPPKGEEKAALANIQLPPAVRQTLLKCVAPPASERPASIDDVLTAIKKWK